MISTGYCAQNLVPNPSFEEYIDCPWSCCDLDLNCVNWYSFSETPDYFNSCSEYTAGVPFNPWGHQFAITGNAYAALVTYSSIAENIREYIATPLTTPIESGESYYIMFYMSQSDGGDLDNWRCATDRIGAKFFNDPDYTPDNPYVPGNDPDLQYNGLFTDTTNWVLIDGWFEADQAYNWVAVGNFFDDEQTDTVQFGEPGKCFGIYYIENVCITTNPTDCDYLKQESDLNSDIEPDESEEFIQIHPNPSPGWFQIIASFVLTEVKVYNAIGQLIIKQYVGQQELNIDGTNWAKGLYILKVKDENNHQQTFKIIKQ